MPTKGRPALAQAALAQFLNQDYAGMLELVIIDGNPDAVDEETATHNRRVLRRCEPDGPHDFGQLFGLAGEAAHGDLWAVWDDDNARAPGYITALVDALMAAPSAPYAALGRRIRLELLPEHDWYLYALLPGMPFDGTLLMHREQVPSFTGTSNPITRHGGAVIDRPELFTWRIHGSNLTGRREMTVHCQPLPDPTQVPASPALPAYILAPSATSGGMMGSR
jgi:hypothetical protein